MQETKEDRVKALESLGTLCEFFQNRVQKAPSDEALREFDKRKKVWVSYSYQTVADKVDAWRRAFAALNLPVGARVAMLLPNGVDAVCFDQAAMANCLVPVPLHAIDTAASSAYILQDSGAQFLVTNKLNRWEKISEAGCNLSAIKKVIITDDQLQSEDGQVEALQSWLADSVMQALPSAKPQADDLACLVYTSGTTGRPKGVMLTHRNVTSNVRSTLGHVTPEIGWVFLSFLPLSHMFERTAGYYLALAMGCTVVFNRSLQYLGEDFKLVKPNVLISVPRIYERIYAKLQEALKKKGKAANFIFNWAVNVGWRDFCKRNGIACESSIGSVFDSTLGRMVRNKVAKTLTDQFGGRLAVAISGGAALNNKVARVFCGLGLPVIQGYGMTETSPIIAGNNVSDNDPSTVGRLLKDVQVKIGEQSEIQVKGDLVMKGYWNLPQATADTMTSDGWLRTGDQGEFDQAGRLKIKGRTKEIIVTSTGEKISPVDIELAVETEPLIDQCYAVGDDKPYIATVLSLNHEHWKALAESLGLDPKASDSLVDPRAKQQVLTCVRSACHFFPAYAIPRNVYLTLEPWTIENGLLTPTLKLKRAPMQAKYKNAIDGMYQGAKR